MVMPPTPFCSLTVNGTTHEVQADLDSPLLLALRNDLGLNGAKVGCALSQCGVCTVLRDGEPIRSCVTTLREAAGAEITTLEGLGTADRLHPIQQAFLAEQAAQCGYCIPGMIVATAALLAASPDPTDAEIVAALSGNLCRCGAHVRIMRAVRRAARLMAAAPSERPFPVMPAELPTPEPMIESEPGERLNEWIELHPDGRATIRAGKVELGTGVRTALTQIVAEELDLPIHCLTMVAGDTATTPDQGTTAGSKTIQTAGPILRRAAAEARATLLARAARRLDRPVDQLVVSDGVVRSPRGSGRSIGYGELIDCQQTSDEPGDVTLKDPATYRVVGESVPRVDLLAKLTGGVAYVHDLKLDGMLHGRVIRPMVRTVDGVGATLLSVDESSLGGLPGIVAVVRSGSFLGVVAEQDAQALAAAQALRTTWSEPTPLPPFADRFDAIREAPTVDRAIATDGDLDRGFAAATQVITATYRHPWQAHASIGPSCAVADVRPDGATVWCASQSVFSLREALAPVLGLPEASVRVIHMEGPGCYGHNGADDVAADAALLSQAVGRPVRVIWSRQGEFAWEGKGPAMVAEVRAGLGAGGDIVAWDYGVWTPTHSTRPGGQPGNLLAAQLREPPVPHAPLGRGGGTRNALTSYRFPNQRLTAHWVTNPALRPSALRSLGGLANTTANETMMDELATLAGADPVAFRLRHLDDPRAIGVIERAAALAGWQPRPAGPSGGPPVPDIDGALTGRGIAFARYETAYAYVAVVAQVRVIPATGAVRVSRVCVAHDCGLIVNPDGVRNQIEGNVIQGISRALLEEVTWDETQVTTLDWDSYQILGFADIPAIEIDLIDRPGEPSWGAGEGAICPMVAVVGNAIFDATGVRLRTVPFTPERIQGALDERST